MNRRLRLWWYARYPVAWVQACLRAVQGPVAYKLKWFHKDWIKLMRDNQRCMVIAPRGYLKSTIVNGLIAWQTLFDIKDGVQPHSLIVCDNEAKEREFAGDLKAIFDSSFVQRLFGGFEVVRTGNNLVIPEHPYIPHLDNRKTIVTSTPAVGVYTVNSGRTGVHINKGTLHLDDAYVSSSARSEVEQETRYQRIHSGWLALIGPQTRVVISGTRYTPQDHYGMLEAQGMPTNLSSRAAITPAGESLWPELWTLEQLAELRSPRQLGAIDFALQYMNDVTAAGGKLFTSKLMALIAGHWPDEGKIRCRCFGVDLNYGGEDASAVVEAIVAEDKIYLRPRLNHSYDEGQDRERLDEVLRITRGWITYVEANGPQKINVDILRRAGHHGVEPFLPRSSKEVRAREMLASMQRDEVRIVDNVTGELTNQLIGFTGRDGDKDDLVDAAVMAWLGAYEWYNQDGPQKIKIDIKPRRGMYEALLR